MIANWFRDYYRSISMKLNRKYKNKINSKNKNIVFFVSFPKSGRTWLHLILARIYSDLTGLDIKLLLNADDAMLKDKVKPYPYIKFSHGYKNSGISQGEVFPEHYYKDTKIILMVRDPRDVVVSHYYHEKYHFKSFEGTISEFIRYQYDVNKPDPGKRKARFGILPIINYMNAWQGNFHILEDYFMLTYEDMKKEPLLYLNELCQYLGLPVNNISLHDVIDYCSFKNMRKLEEASNLEWNGLEPSDSQQGFKTRKGKAGGFRDELSENDINYIEGLIKEKLDPAYSQYIYTTDFK